METRLIKEYKICGLYLECMRGVSLAAISFDKEKLINWYDNQFIALQPHITRFPHFLNKNKIYWFKHYFEPGSLLYYFIPIKFTSEQNKYEVGYFEQWIREEDLKELENKLLCNICF